MAKKTQQTQQTQQQETYVTRYGRTVRRPALYTPEDEGALLPDDFREDEHDVAYIQAMLAALKSNRWGEDPITRAERDDISSGSDESEDEADATVLAQRLTRSLRQKMVLQQQHQPQATGNTDTDGSSDEEYVPPASVSSSSGSDVDENSNASDDESMFDVPEGGDSSEELAW
jgi:hypothetical protein